MSARRAGSLLVTVAAALAITPAAATAHGPLRKHLTVSSGTVAARLDYRQRTDRYGNRSDSSLRLAITRSGETFYSQGVRSSFCGNECSLEAFSGSPLKLEDLEGVGQPQVLLYLYTGGAHCCTVLQVFSYDPALSSYRPTERNFGDAAARLSDIDHDGQLEFYSADDRFAYEFAAYAFSGLPVQILRFSGARFIDVTRQFPRQIAADSRDQFRAFVANRRSGFGLGFIAAWAADQDLLGHSSRVTSILERELRAQNLRSGGYGPSGRAFIRALRRFLTRNGYL